MMQLLLGCCWEELAELSEANSWSSCTMVSTSPTQKDCSHDIAHATIVKLASELGGGCMCVGPCTFQTLLSPQQPQGMYRDSTERRITIY